MFRKALSNTMLLAAIPVAANTAQTSGGEPTLKRPTDLPIYNTNDEKKKTESIETGVVRSSVENGIKVVRVACCDAVKTIQVRKKPIDEFVATGIEHSQFIYDFLNEPTNGVHRSGAIAVGALAGYIIGLRSGFIRRLIYTSIGGLGVASVCYPKEARVYSQKAIAEAKTYATIVYNFAYGIKPGDEPAPSPIPSSLSEFYGNLLSTNKKKDQ